MLLNLSNYNNDIDYKTINNDCYISFNINNSGYQIEDYQLKMLNENKMDNFTEFNYTVIDDEVTFNYKVTSLISLDYFLKTAKLSREETIALLRGMISAFKNITLYQLNANCICFDMEYLYIDINTFEPYLVYLPIQTESSLGYMEFKKFVKSLILDSHIEICTDNFIQILLLQLNEKEFNFTSWEKLLLNLFNSNTTAYIDRNLLNNINYNKVLSGQVYERPTAKPSIEEPAVETAKKKLFDFSNLKNNSSNKELDKKGLTFALVQIVFFMMLVFGFNANIINLGFNMFLFVLIVVGCDYLLYKRLYSKNIKTIDDSINVPQNIEPEKIENNINNNLKKFIKTEKDKVKFAIYLVFQVIIAIALAILVISGVFSEISQIFLSVVIILGVDYLIFNNMFIKEKNSKKVKKNDSKKGTKPITKEIPTNDAFGA